LIIVFIIGYLLKKPSYFEITLVNPISDLVFTNTNEAGIVDKGAVIKQAVIEFDADYINYILAALGTGYLHKSIFGESPILELILDGEVWHAEVNNGIPNSALGAIDNEDLRITISKEEAVNAILSTDIEQFMKDSINKGNIKVDMVANEAELFAKGYLDMSNALTFE